MYKSFNEATEEIGKLKKQIEALEREVRRLRLKDDKSERAERLEECLQSLYDAHFNHLGEPELQFPDITINQLWDEAKELL